MIRLGQKLGCTFGLIKNYGVRFLDLMTISVALAHSASLYMLKECVLLHVSGIEVIVCFETWQNKLQYWCGG